MICKHVYERGLMNFTRFSVSHTSTVLSVLIGAFLIAVLAMSIGCGEKNEEKAGATDQSKAYSREYFADWLKHRSEIFELRFPPSENLRERTPDIGNKCDQIMALLSQMLRIRPPETVYMMIFENQFEAEELFGRQVPFVSNDTIFYEIFAPIGAPIAELMMKRVVPKGSKYEFVNEGFPTLIDFSGENYHQNVLYQVENGTAFEIDSLVDNDFYLRQPYQQRKEQAASFIGFLTKNFGSAPLLGLLKQDMSVNGIMMMSTKRGINVLAHEWKSTLAYLAQPDSALIKAQQRQEDDGE